MYLFMFFNGNWRWLHTFTDMDKKIARKQKVIPVALNYVKTGKILKVAICLQARDYKGFNTGSQLMNGVLVVNEHYE